MIAKNQIWKLYGTEYKEMTKELLSKADLAGLIGGREKRVAIKPNLVVASPAEFGATTHPEVVAGIVAVVVDQAVRIVASAESLVPMKQVGAVSTVGLHKGQKKSLLLIGNRDFLC